MPDEILEPLGISDENIWTPIGRRLEAMTKRQALTLVILYFVVALITGIFVLCLSPHYCVRVVEQFSQWNPTFQWNISDLSSFSDFLELSLHVDTLRQEHVGDCLLKVDYEITTLNDGIEQSSGRQITSQLRNSSVMIWSTDVVNFDELRMQLVMHVDNVKALGGSFTWSFANPPHVISQLFIRCVIFLVSFAVILNLFFSGIGSVILKMMAILNLVIFTASNPFYILTFYGDFTILRIYDTCMSMLCVICVWFCSLSSLNLRKLTHRDVGFVWLAKRSIVFVIAFVTMAASILVTKAGTREALDYVVLFFILIYFFMFVFSIITYRTDLVQERATVIVFSVIAVLSTIWTKFACVFDTGDRNGLKAYSLVMCSLYTFMFSFLNWPVDPSLALRDTEEPKTNEIEAEETTRLDLGMETPL